VSALTQQFPLDKRTVDGPRPALAICDWGLQSAVKIAVAATAPWSITCST